MSGWLIYGANGYTGKLMVEEATQRGMRPVLSGRSEGSIRELADQYGLEWRAFSLDDAEAVKRGLDGMTCVLHCAGPFSATSQPMIEGCLATGTHYLDITGEISVFANAHAQSNDARRADVALVPGVGFDVVPTDCLAALLVQQLPAATHLQLAFDPGGGLSPGTAKTSVEGLGSGGRVRRDGEMTRVPLGYKTREIPFAHATRNAVTIPWGDVYTAFVSTGVPNIEVYLSVPPSSVKRLQRLRMIQPLLKLGFVQNWLKGRVDRSIKGPDAEKRASTNTELWGEVTSADGRTVSGTMTTPNGYELTVTAGLGIVEHLLQHGVEGGYYTPSLLMGPDYAATLPGVTVRVPS